MYALQSRSEAEGLPVQPLTEVMPEAQDRLKDWGLSDQSIRELQDMTAAFRYDTVPNRLLEIFSNNEVFVSKNDQGEKHVVVPNYYNAMGSLEGNCHELGFQFLKNPVVDNWLSDNNEQLIQDGKMPLELTLCTGQAGEFFVSEESTHFWVGIRPQGSGKIEESIDIDPALQKIGSPTENNYKRQHTFGKVQNMSMPLSQRFKVGTMYPGEDSTFTYTLADEIMLGVSSERAHAYGLSFVENEVTGDILPVVTRSDKNDQPDGFFFLDIQTGNVFEGGYQNALSPSQDQEVTKILQACSMIRYNTDLSQFPTPIDRATLETPTQVIKNG